MILAGAAVIGGISWLIIQIQEKDATISRLHSDAVEVYRESVAKDETIQQLNAEVQSQDAEIQRLNGTNSQLQHRVDKLMETNSQLQDRVDELFRDIQRINPDYVFQDTVRKLLDSPNRISLD